MMIRLVLSGASFGAYLYWEDPDRLHKPINQVKREFNKSLSIFPDSIRDTLTLHVENDPIPAGTRNFPEISNNSAHIFKPPPAKIAETAPPVWQERKEKETQQSQAPQEPEQKEVVLIDAIIVESPPELGSVKDKVKEQVKEKVNEVKQEAKEIVNEAKQEVKEIVNEVKKVNEEVKVKDELPLESSTVVQELKGREDYKKYKELLELQVTVLMTVGTYVTRNCHTRLRYTMSWKRKKKNSKKELSFCVKVSKNFW
jgi:hypothetical protein